MEFLQYFNMLIYNYINQEKDGNSDDIISERELYDYIVKSKNKIRFCISKKDAIKLIKEANVIFKWSDTNSDDMEIFYNAHKWAIKSSTYHEKPYNFEKSLEVIIYQIIDNTLNYNTFKEFKKSLNETSCEDVSSDISSD